MVTKSENSPSAVFSAKGKGSTHSGTSGPHPILNWLDYLGASKKKHPISLYTQEVYGRSWTPEHLTGYVPIETFGATVDLIITDAVERSIREAVYPLKKLEAAIETLQIGTKSHKHRLDRLEKEVKELCEALKVRPATENVEILDLGSETYSLRHPISIVLEKYETEVVAKCPELETFGSASSEGAAINALKQEIITLYEDLISSPVKKLGRLPKMWLRILNQLIVKNKRS